MNAPANSAVLMGEIAQEAVFSHSFGADAYYGMLLSVRRLSGVADVLPLTAPASLSPQTLREGQTLLVHGQLRSYRHFDGEKNRLCLSVYCRTLQTVFEAPPSPNSVALAGSLVRAPIYRHTPLGREICDLLLSVPRPYGKNDVIPVIAWGACAAICADLPGGQKLRVKGRFQSRQYQKKLEDGSVVQRVAYELSATEIGTCV